jgi:site-specific recombinase XerD
VITLPDYAQAFLDDLDMQTSSRRTYGYRLAAFALFMQTKYGSTDLAELDGDCLKEFREWMVDGGDGRSYTARTVEANVAAAGRMLAWLVEDGQLPNSRLVKILQGEIAEPELPDYAREFLEGLRVAPNTEVTYRHGLSAFFTFAQGAYGTTDLIQLDENCLRRFNVWMTKLEGDGRGYSASTARAYMAAVKRLLIWLDAHDQLPDWSLTKALRRLEAQKGRGHRAGYRHRVIDPGIPRIVTYYDEMPLPEMPIADGGMTRRDRQRRRRIRRERLRILRARAVVHVLYSTAARVSEIASLRRQDVAKEEEGKPIEIESKVLISGKGRKERCLFFFPKAQEALKTYLAERGDDGNEWLFASHSRRHKGHRLTRSSVWAIVKKAARALNLHSDTCAHSIRHFVAAQLLNADMPPTSVQEFLGHEDISTTTRIYAPTTTATVERHLRTYRISPREAVAALDAGEGLPETRGGLEELLTRFRSVAEDALSSVDEAD